MPSGDLVDMTSVSNASYNCHDKRQKGGADKKEVGMKQAQVLKISDFKPKKPCKKDELNQGKRGSVYGRNGKLWVNFRYLNNRVREPVGLGDTPQNRITIRKKLDKVLAEIDSGKFEFARRFPYSKKKEFFSILETGTYEQDPSSITFGEYYEKWFKEMSPGMSESKIRDYQSALKNHIMPYFKNISFNAFTPVLMKKFQAHLKAKQTPRGTPLSNKRILNIFIPLRVVVSDAFLEYSFNMPNPFVGLKLPNSKKFRVHPFNYEEWDTLMGFMHEWYRPYFEFAVNTGLRPSEQVALKWSVVFDDVFSVELSRVKNREKTDLKTESSFRLIAMTDTIRDILDRQRQMVCGIESEYVFVNTEGRPILQDKLRELWLRVMKKSGLPMRRMYETRHTFASWALAAGESPEWVARTLGHVDTSMVFRTYGRYIPNLTRQDGSAFERVYREKNENAGQKKL